ncbi:MAG: CHRD domain-containing protein [Burkholderiales bacterium]
MAGLIFLSLIALEEGSMTTRTFLMVAITLMGGFVASHAMAQGQLPEKPALFAVLLGGNEVAGNGLANAGDPNGVGTATVLFDNDGTTLCFSITVNNIDGPTMAHIHRGLAGVNGPIVVTLVHPTSGNPGVSSDCIAGVDSALASEIRGNPGRFYVNVHTTAFPNGAMRGQLF